MDLLRTEDVATVILFDLRLSEGEFEYLAIAAKYLLDNLSDQQLHAVFALIDEDAREQLSTPTESSREFLEGTNEEIVAILQHHCGPEFLPARFRK